jgi:hypothetical protein
MADRYWVGGTASWDTTAGTKWATTSGGAGGAAVPTNADDVYIDANSGAVTVTLVGNRAMKTLDFTGFTGTFGGTSGSGLNIHGDTLTFGAGMTNTNAGYITFYLVAATLTLNDVALSVYNITSNTDLSVVGDLILPGTITIFGGVFSFNGNTTSCANFSTGASPNSAITLDLTNATLNCANWTIGNPSQTTIITTGSSITSTGTSFNGGSKTYNTVTLDPTSGTTTIVGSNTFDTLEITTSKTAQFTASTTQTVTDYIPNTNTTIRSTTDTPATLAKAGGGTVTLNSATITRINATPSDTWIALSSTLTSTNGWVTDLPEITDVSTEDRQSTEINIAADALGKGGTIFERGFVYDTVPRSLPGNVSPAASGYISTDGETGSFSDGEFEQSVTGLAQATTYFARAYAQNIVGYSYSDEVTFSTLTFPNTDTVFNIPTNTALLSNISTGSIGLTQTSTVPTTLTNKTTSPSSIINLDTDPSSLTNL